MNRLLGIVLVAVSAAAFGTLAIFGRYADAAGIDVLTVLFFRFSLAAVVLVILFVARREPLPRGLTLLQLVGMGAIGYMGQAFCYLTALKYASAGLVALLLYLYPVFVAILSTLWLREPMTRWKMGALGLALAGTALTVGPEGGQLLGVLLAISGAAIYSVYIMVATKVMKQVSAIQSSTVILSSAGAMSGILMLAKGPDLPTTGAGWATIGSLVLIATVLPIVTFLAGLERIGPTNAAMLSTLEPVVTVLLAAMLFGETLRPVTLLGGALVLLAVLLLTGSEIHSSRPAPMGDLSD
jgi:drug/metabolite transporter (DMT)-like permease